MGDSDIKNTGIPCQKVENSDNILDTFCMYEFREKIFHLAFFYRRNIEIFLISRDRIIDLVHYIYEKLKLFQQHCLIFRNCKYKYMYTKSPYQDGKLILTFKQLLHIFEENWMNFDTMGETHRNVPNICQKTQKLERKQILGTKKVFVMHLLHVLKLTSHKKNKKKKKLDIVLYK